MPYELELGEMPRPFVRRFRVGSPFRRLIVDGRVQRMTELIDDDRLSGVASAVQRMVEAAAEVETAKWGCAGRDALASAHDELRAAVEAAYDRGATWQTIGDALGLRRGCAYQRYRR